MYADLTIPCCASDFKWIMDRLAGLKLYVQSVCSYLYQPNIKQILGGQFATGVPEMSMVQPFLLVLLGATVTLTRNPHDPPSSPSPALAPGQAECAWSASGIRDVSEMGQKKRCVDIVPGFYTLM